MIFNEHGELSGKHAFLSGSQSSWINATPEKLISNYRNSKAKELGTKLHEFASQAINLRVKLEDNRKALNMFVNDVIGFDMESERVLYYSQFCFGTADAISYVEPIKKEKGYLRIFDLKTGYIKASFRQLNVYAAIFCLEYNQDPFKMDIEQRIYQSGEIKINMADPYEIKDIMDKIIEFNRILELQD